MTDVYGYDSGGSGGSDYIDDDDEGIMNAFGGQQLVTAKALLQGGDAGGGVGIGSVVGAAPMAGVGLDGASTEESRYLQRIATSTHGIGTGEGGGAPLDAMPSRAYRDAGVTAATVVMRDDEWRQRRLAEVHDRMLHGWSETEITSLLKVVDLCAASDESLKTFVVLLLPKRSLHEVMAKLNSDSFKLYRAERVKLKAELRSRDMYVRATGERLMQSVSKSAAAGSASAKSVRQRSQHKRARRRGAKTYVERRNAGEITARVWSGQLHDESAVTADMIAEERNARCCALEEAMATQAERTDAACWKVESTHGPSEVSVPIADEDVKRRHTLTTSSTATLAGATATTTTPTSAAQINFHSGGGGSRGYSDVDFSD